ncbi:MAG: right-handed parallel beta-helix repeat-containing protein, partial [Deltaproteobacteria bacterium]|nr:right-handed parallel beta-helix repeat-containing protein [Deltaproteobacteria bacterium]
MNRWSGAVCTWWLALGSVALLSSPALAADWHVAPGGVDGAAGSQQAPLATLPHAVSRASGTDRILLRRGGTYLVTNLDAGATLQIAAYGDGPDPVITASAVVGLPGTWASNPLVRTGPVASPVLACYVDGRFVPLARYPNTGFLRVQNDDSPDQIVDEELAARPGAAAGRWTGAQVRWRRWSWWWETRPIASHEPVDTLNLGPDGRFQDPFSDPGSGFFIDNDLDELDAPGEWFWGDGTLYLYPPDWADPSTMVVEVVTSSESGVKTSGTGFSGVAFKRFVATALQLGRPAVVDGCTFEQLDTNAIGFTWDSQPFVVRNSVFRDVHNVAISGWANPAGAQGSLVERNLFHRIGVEQGYGGSGSWHAAGVIIGRANAAMVQLNRFVDIGYAGVILGSDGQTVQRNLFARTMRSLNDGAAVYTNCNASIIRENIILDTFGNLETSHPWYPLGHGIWPEFLSQFHDSQIVDNTIYGSNGNGIFLPNNFTCTVTGNVSLDNRVSGLDLQGTASDSQSHVIRDNTLAAVVPSRQIPRPENLSKWWLPPYTAPTPVALRFEKDVHYGSMSDTTFIAPASGAGAGVIRQSDVADYDTLDAWTAAAPWASASGSRVVRANAILLFNDTEAATEMAVPAGAAWTLPDGSAVGASVSIPAFRSVVLITSGAVSANPPYHSASGIDWRSETPVAGVLLPTPEIAVLRDALPIANGSTDPVPGTAAGSRRTLTYTLENQGGAALTVPAPVATSALVNCAVAVDGQPASPVAISGSTTLRLAVTPTAAGAWSFAVSFATNDPDENPTAWTVSGTASSFPEPDLSVTRGGALVASSGTDSIAGTSAGVPMVLTYALTNSGSAALAVTTPISVSASSNCEAAVTAQPSSTLAAQASSHLVVSVTPSTAGPWSFRLEVLSDDPSPPNPYSWVVSGTAGGSAGLDGGQDTGSSSVDASGTSADAAASDAGGAGQVVAGCGCAAGPGASSGLLLGALA